MKSFILGYLMANPPYIYIYIYGGRGFGIK